MTTSKRAGSSMLWAGLLGILMALPLSQAAAGEAIDRGKILANTCAGCHGYEGYSPGPIAPLAGLEADYIVTSMKAFKKGTRPATVMNRIAKGYSDADIQAMAKYFAQKEAQ